MKFQGLCSKKIQKTLILAFEANSALSRKNETKIVKITHKQCIYYVVTCCHFQGKTEECMCPKAATAKKEGNLGVKSGLIGQFEYDHHDLSHFGGHCFAISFIATLSNFPFSQLICLVFLQYYLFRLSYQIIRSKLSHRINNDVNSVS